jgi:ABC-type transport system involved in multi-copper enzyme maturation permease subunit
VYAWHFALFQFGVFFLFGLTAIRRLPSSIVWGGTTDTMTGTERVKTAAKQATWTDRKPTDPPPVLKPEKEPVNRPPVTDLSIVWWERFGWLNQGQVGFVTKVFTWRLWAVAAVAFTFYFSLRVFEWVWPSNPREIRDVASIALLPVMIFGMIFLFPPAFRAARCVAKEREADTLDGLLLLPLSRSEILFQKWLGVALCDWPGFAPLLVILATGTLTGFMAVSAAVVYAITVPVLVGVLTAWGLYFSVVSKTSRAAITRVVMFLIVMTFVLNAALALLSGAFDPPGTRPRLDHLVPAAVFPPAAFPILMAELDGTGPPKGREFNPGGVLAAWLCGLTVYAASGWLAYWLACRRFESEKAS